MSSPKSPSRYDELAALHAVDLLDDDARQELLDAAERDPAIEALLRDYAETAALFAYEAPQIQPAPGLKEKILRQLPARAGAKNSKIIPFHQLIPYAIAACLMALGIAQSIRIGSLKSENSRMDSQLADMLNDKFLRSKALASLQLTTLEAKDAAYAAAKVLVAWDSSRGQGVLSIQGLPAAPAGKNYQLWVLDPAAPAPVSAGVVTDSRAFYFSRISTPHPGFAVSLEPAGGVPEPTGPILFAVAPGL